MLLYQSLYQNLRELIYTMARYFRLHSENPQKRIINQAVEAIKAGEIIAYPSDSAYALGCALNNRLAVETMRRIRQFDEKHPMTLVCDNISQVSQYAMISDRDYKIIKKLTPGPYTFLLKATKNIPKIAQGGKRKEVGIRIPNHAIPLKLVEELGEPILSSTLWLPTHDAPLEDANLIIEATNRMVDFILDGGICHPVATTIIDLLGDTPVIVRVGAGEVDDIEKHF